MQKFLPLILSVLVHLPLIFAITQNRPLHKEKQHTSLYVSTIHQNSSIAKKTTSISNTVNNKAPINFSEPQQSNSQQETTTLPNSATKVQIPFHQLANGRNFTLPTYPPRALENRIEATILVEIELSSSGKITNLSWINEDKKNLPFFVEVEKAIANWEFDPCDTFQIRTTQKEFVFKLKE